MFDVIIIDLAVLLGCITLLTSQGRLSHSHPATIYLIFHALVVSVRAIAIANGAEPYLTGFGFPFEPVRIEELRRAVLLADAALVAMTFGCLHGVKLGRRRFRALEVSGESRLRYRRLSGKLLRIVSGGALLIGLWGLFQVATLPGEDGGSTQEGLLSSGYAFITFTWVGLGLLALIYWYGHRWWLLAPMVGYLALAGIQGGLRFRFVIPAILLAQIWLDRRYRRWPSPRILVLGCALLLVFFPLKTIGSLVQRGAPAEEILTASRDTIADTLTGGGGGLAILDQFAMTLSLTDDSGTVLLGRPYLSMVTLPVPRYIWSEKPGLADHIEELSTVGRPMGDLGMVTTLWGDAYVNFWYFGLVAVPYLLGAFLTRLYLVAYSVPYNSVERFAYLLVACNLIQVYRDGLVSLPLFVLVQMLPLAILVLWHWLRAASISVCVPRSMSVDGRCSAGEAKPVNGSAVRGLAKGQPRASQ